MVFAIITTVNEHTGIYIMSSIKEILPHIKTLHKFVSPQQIAALGMGCRTEEKEFFFEKIEELSNTFNTMPKTYEQDGKGDEATVYLHYFRGDMDWYITEKDMEDEQIQAFGIDDIGMGASLGYISLVELASHNVEIDLHWTPKTISYMKLNNII